MKTVRKQYNAWIWIALFCALILSPSACSSGESDKKGAQQGEASWESSSTVEATLASTTIVIEGTAGMKWVAEITAGTTWCSFTADNYSGDGAKKSGAISTDLAKNEMTVYFATNKSQEQRKANITIYFDNGQTSSLSLTQLAAKPQVSEAYWQESSTVNASSASSVIILSGTPDVEWSAEITEGESWCSFSADNYGADGAKKSGVISTDNTKNALTVYYSTNNEKTQRQANITVTFNSRQISDLSLIQLSKEEQTKPQFGGWAELPTNQTNANFQYVTHYALLDNKTVRNYSMCYDKTKKAALWVAYPLHNAYLGSTKRTDEWAYDPIISKEYQPTLKRSYKSPYDRGHQLPSADRLANYELNAQTFYFSNMTPQLDSLNQFMWEKLERKVRNSRCSDTLYVVTGAYFGNDETTTDGAGVTVALPTNYFKVLLRTKSGNTGKAIKDCAPSELISIGFWVDQASYGKGQPPTTICTTVEEIETKTGFKFFPMVDASVKKQNAPSVWGI